MAWKAAMHYYQFRIEVIWQQYPYSLWLDYTYHTKEVRFGARNSTQQKPISFRKRNRWNHNSNTDESDHDWI